MISEPKKNNIEAKNRKPFKLCFYGTNCDNFYQAALSLLLPHLFRITYSLFQKSLYEIMTLLLLHCCLNNHGKGPLRFPRQKQV